MTQEEREAQQKLKELAMYYAQPHVEKGTQIVQREASRGIGSLGLDPEQVAASVAAAKMASDIAKGELNLKGTIAGGLSGEVTMSPREKAIRLMYNRSF